MGKLTAGGIPHLDDGVHYDGDGLRLQIRGAKRNWSVQYTALNGRRREMGLGGYPTVGLEKARDYAAALRDKLRKEIDPLEEKRALRVAAAAAKAAAKVAKEIEVATLSRVVRDYHKDNIEGSHKAADQWLSSIENHLPAKLLNKPIAEIEAAELLDELRPIYERVPETGRRIRQRLDAVFDDAVIRKLVKVNPCKSIVRRLRGKKKRIKGHFAALPFKEAPALFKQIASLPGAAAHALQFAMLTASRTSEVLKMPWSEVSDKTWTVPAERMKAGEEHVVVLSPPAQSILKKMKGKSEEWIFPSPERDAPLSAMGMLMLLRRLDAEKRTTVHGLCRATFSTWAYENAVARPDVIEATLAHREANLTKAAYNHAKFFEERRALLAAWGKYLTGKTS